MIGAMLVAPLMGPIVALGMGLAVGSPYLVVRGTARVIFSVLFVIAMSAGITWLLPFHEVNAEIAARTTPTALDLGTAVFCAIAGVYAALRPSSDVATTAAGTSIGISLVPPLCVSGYGVGTRAWDIATGASMLFLTNFVAIVLVGTVVFAMAGFGQVDLRAIESEEIERGRDAALARAVARGLSRLFRSRTGPVFRALMPLLLLAAVFSPLRKGLNEVAWQIEARAAIEAAIGDLPSRVVESRVRVERRHVELMIFLLGAPADAVAARESLSTRLASATGVTPRIEVFAVPDASEFEALERSLQKPIAPPATPVPTVEPPAVCIEDAHDAFASALDRRWPHAEAGEILALELVARDAGAVSARVTHWGRALDPATVETLERALSDDLEAPVSLEDSSIPEDTIDLTGDDGTALSRVAEAVAASKRIAIVRLCLVEPERKPAKQRKDRPLDVVSTALRALLAAHERVERSSGGERLTLRFTAGTCADPER